MFAIKKIMKIIGKGKAANINGITRETFRD
jgi:hypothetical protein